MNIRPGVMTAVNPGVREEEWNVLLFFSFLELFLSYFPR